MHVGLIGDKWPDKGSMSAWYRQQLTYKIFLFYARIPPDEASDQVLRDATVKTIRTSGIDHVVCLALDPVYDNNGARREDASHVWADNAYVLELKAEIGEKVLFGASVHPYDPSFKDRTAECVEAGAVLMKWLPSAQQFTLADARAREALEFLATARHGKPLPLLLHCGMEYAIPTMNPRTQSYDLLRWTWQDKVGNFLRGKNKKWHTPDIKGIHDTLEAGLKAGAHVIFAHCGTPYFAGGVLGGLLEHDDLPVVKKFMEKSKHPEYAGKCYGDVSAFCTPFRKKYYKDIRKLPRDRILFGSDFPTPAFEIHADAKEHLEDLKAVLEGHFERVIVPEDNLLDVNYRELRQAFGDHPMFGNFERLVEISA
jgi:predicted TIM-barrel fold metal-dependent hydrolase